MFTKKPSLILLVTVLALTACVSQPQAITQPAATSVPLDQPTTTPAVAPAAAPTEQPKSTPTATPSFEGLSSGLDNVAQARIRTVSEVLDAPNTDVYVNGMLASNGGVAQQNIGAGQFSGWLYVQPGTYTIALVPHGGKMEQALFTPVDVKAEAGHRYTVAAMGQLADKDIHPLVVDETALEAGLGAGVTDNRTIDINNLKGADSITEQAYGKTMAENIKYGEARAMFTASGTPKFSTLVNSGGTTKLLMEGTTGAEPGTSFVLPWFGPYPADNYDSVGNVSQGTSELNVLDFLAGFSERDVRFLYDKATFGTFLTAIEKAGFRDQLVSSGPYFLLAPNDAAFAALSQADRDALFNDPQMLKNLLNSLIVDGYYPYGSLSGSVYDEADITVTNRLGKPLSFKGETLNFYPIGPNYTVGNGIRVQIIYTLLPYK